MAVQRYRATVIEVGRGRVVVPVPFDPDEAFGAKVRHHVTGTVNGMGVRAVIEPIDGGYGIVLGAAWRRDCGPGPGDAVEVALAAEGPQRDDLPADLAAALQDNSAAGEFFDSLAQFLPQGISAVDRGDPAQPATSGRTDRRDGAAARRRAQVPPHAVNGL